MSLYTKLSSPPASRQQAGAWLRRQNKAVVRSARPVAVNAARQSQGGRITTDGKAVPVIDNTGLSRRLALLATIATPSMALLPTFSIEAQAATGPQALEGAAKAAVDAALKKVIVKSKAPVMLRLVFHDAGTYDAAAGDGGPNASVRFELERPENFGLKRGWNLVEAVQQGLKGTAAEGVVSQADIIALGGAYAVALTGGPVIPVLVGRKDSDGPDPEGRLPSEKAPPEVLKSSFAAKGLSVREMLVLSGAHTLGSKGFGDPVTFDEAYFTALRDRSWLKVSGDMREHIGLPSDRMLPDDPECYAIIQEYASDKARFFQDFSAAYLKLTAQGAVWA